MIPFLEDNTKKTITTWCKPIVIPRPGENKACTFEKVFGVDSDTLYTLLSTRIYDLKYENIDDWTCFKLGNDVTFGWNHIQHTFWCNSPLELLVAIAKLDGKGEITDHVFDVLAYHFRFDSLAFYSQEFTQRDILKRCGLPCEQKLSVDCPYYEPNTLLPNEELIAWTRREATANIRLA